MSVVLFRLSFCVLIFLATLPSFAPKADQAKALDDGTSKSAGMPAAQGITPGMSAIGYQIEGLDQFQGTASSITVACSDVQYGFDHSNLVAQRTIESLRRAGVSDNSNLTLSFKNVRIVLHCHVSGFIENFCIAESEISLVLKYPSIKQDEISRQYSSDALSRSPPELRCLEGPNVIEDAFMGALDALLIDLNRDVKTVNFLRADPSKKRSDVSKTPMAAQLPKFAAPADVNVFQGQWESAAVQCGMDDSGYSRHIRIMLSVDENIVRGHLRQYSFSDSNVSDEFSSPVPGNLVLQKQLDHVDGELFLKFDRVATTVTGSFDGCALYLSRR